MGTLILLFFGWCVTSVIVNGSIFDTLRNYLIVKYPFFGKLTSCVMCLSVWIGAIIFWISLPTKAVDPIESERFPVWVNYVIFPFVQSGVSVLIESFVIFLVKGARPK